jgi:hypothetical protein
MVRPVVPQGRLESSNPIGNHSTPLIHDPMTHMWHILPKVDLNKFDGSNPTRWVTYKEHYFSLHGIINGLMKLHVGVLYLNHERWKWCKWNKKSHGGYVTWTQFFS